MTNRTSQLTRSTKETKIQVQIDLDGTGKANISTGIGFLDHMWTAFSMHSCIDLRLSCDGDLHVDDHHTSEDCALCVGEAIDQALGTRKAIYRFASTYAPLDETLVRCVLDLSGRPHHEVHLRFERPMLGALATENVSHSLRSLALAAKCALHVDWLRGNNDHHCAEAAFKATALAFRHALTRDPRRSVVPSTKGSL